MKVKDFKEYLEKYDDEKDVIFKLPSGITYNIDRQLMARHNIEEMTERKECKVYLK